MDDKNKIGDALRLIFDGIKSLRDAFPKKEFTIDGRLVGDIGEVLAALEYDIELFDVLSKDTTAKHLMAALSRLKRPLKILLRSALCLTTIWA